MNEITYLESFKIAWLHAWRFVLISMLVGVLGGTIVGVFGFILGIEKSIIQGLIGLVTWGLSLFYVYPIVVRMALEKSFKGFRLQIVRDSN